MFCEDQAVLLQDIAADVERQIFAVDYAANEAQVLGQKLSSVLHDEDAVYVELYAALVFGMVKIQRSLAGNIEQRGVL
jgi:hypothetical protein